MTVKDIANGLFKKSAERPFSKVALAPIVDLPHPEQMTVNPLKLRGLYDD